MYNITLAHGKKTLIMWYSNHFKMVFEAVPFSCRCPTPLYLSVLFGLVFVYISDYSSSDLFYNIKILLSMNIGNVFNYVGSLNFDV